MNASNSVKQMMASDNQYPDPGASGTINHDRYFQVVQLVSLAAETRTLARPKKLGAIMMLNFKTNGGNITLTVTGGYNLTADTVYVFTTAGQALFLQAQYDGTNYFWRAVGSNPQSLAVGAAAGITGGAGTLFKSSVKLEGNIYKTTIFIDLTGLGTSTTDLDIIGQGVSAAYLCQLGAQNGGTIDAITMTCLELPTTGADDIDLYSATEATGKFDDAITGLTETALLTSGGAWANGTVKSATTCPATGQYLYLTNGEGGTVGTYDAGKFLIEIFGH